MSATKRATRPAKAATPAPKTGRLRPLEDFVLLNITPADAISKGGIILPESAQSLTNRGVVAAVGPGLVSNGVLVPTTVKVGEHVLFEQYAGSVITIDDVQYRILRQPAIIAVLDG